MFLIIFFFLLFNFEFFLQKTKLIINLFFVFQTDQSKGSKRQLFVKTLSVRPRVFEVPNFLTDEECDHLVDIAKKSNLEKSKVIQKEKKKIEFGKKKKKRLNDLNSFSFLLLFKTKIVFFDTDKKYNCISTKKGWWRYWR